MAVSNKKTNYRLIAASTVLLFIFGFGYFAGNDDSTLNFKSSVEIGISSMSPRGISGGFIIPASCPSYEHFAGQCCVPDGSCSAPAPACEQTTYGTDNCGTSCSRTGPACPCVPDGSCSAPAPACEQTTYGTDNCGTSCSRTGPVCPPPGVDILADGVNGPVIIPNNMSVIISWSSSGANFCTVTRNGGACTVSGSACNELNFSGSAGNSGTLTTGSYRYTLTCWDPGLSASDYVDVIVSAPTACNNNADDDGDGLRDWNDGIANGVLPPTGFSADPGCTGPSDTSEANRYLCSQGVCSSIEGTGFNNAGCSYNRYLTSSRCALTQCNDGIDNDGDGKTDFPADLGCTSVYDNNESNIPTIFKECDPGLQTCQ